MFEMKPIEEIIRIAAAGGGFRLDASAKHINDLVRIAAAASKYGAQIILTGLQMRPIEDLIRISAAGQGSVFFED